MKWLTVFCLLFLFSCNNNNKPQKIAPVVTMSEEDSLLNIVKQHPDSNIFRENIIQFYRDQEAYSKAITQADEPLRRDSNNHRMWYIKGILQAENNDTTAAIHSLEKAASLYTDADYLLRLGNLYALTGNIKAIQLADALSKYDIAPEKILFIKGSYYLSVNDKIKGINFMDQALNINFTFMEAYLEKAIALYSQQKYEAALQVLNKAVTLQNSFEEGYFYSGMCLEKLNRIEDAKEAYQKALMYDAQYEEATIALQRLEKTNP